MTLQKGLFLKDGLFYMAGVSGVIVLLLKGSANRFEVLHVCIFLENAWELSPYVGPILYMDCKKCLYFILPRLDSSSF